MVLTSHKCHSRLTGLHDSPLLPHHGVYCCLLLARQLVLVIAAWLALHIACWYIQLPPS